MDSFASQNLVIGYVALGVSGLAIAIAIFSSIVGLKLIGIELLIPVQLIYFSLATIPNPGTYTFSLKEL